MFTDTYRFTQLAGNTPLLSTRVAPQYMLPAEAWADLTLLKRVIDLQCNRQLVSTSDGWLHPQATADDQMSRRNMSVEAPMIWCL